VKRAGVFLDRDGTLIEDLHYPRDPEKVKLLPGAIESLLELQKKGYLLFVVSNQSGVGRGLISQKQFESVHQRVSDLLVQHEVYIQDWAYCFHKPEDNCKCRKPGTQLILDLSERYQIDLSKSVMIGDKWSDVLMAHRAGAKGVLLGSKPTEKRPSELDSVPFLSFSDWREINQLMS